MNRCFNAQDIRYIAPITSGQHQASGIDKRGKAPAGHGLFLPGHCCHRLFFEATDNYITDPISTSIRSTDRKRVSRRAYRTRQTAVPPCGRRRRAKAPWRPHSCPCCEKSPSLIELENVSKVRVGQVTHAIHNASKAGSIRRLRNEKRNRMSVVYRSSRPPKCSS